MAVDLLAYVRGDGRRYWVATTRGERFIMQTQSDPSRSGAFYHLRGRLWTHYYADNNFIYQSVSIAETIGRYSIQRTGDQVGAIWARRSLEINGRTNRRPLVDIHDSFTCKLVERNQIDSSIVLLEVKQQHTFASGVTLPDVLVVGWIFKDGNVEERRYYARGYGLVAWENDQLENGYVIGVQAPQTVERQPLYCFPLPAQLYYEPTEPRRVRVVQSASDGLNMRTKPSITGETRIGTALAGMEFEVVRRVGAWWEVVVLHSPNFFGGKMTAYMYAAYMEAVPSAGFVTEEVDTSPTEDVPYVEIVDTDWLNVRTRPALGGEDTIMAVVARGTILEALRIEGDWLEIVLYRHPQLDNGMISGYVYRQYVSFLPFRGNRFVVDIADELPRHPTKQYDRRNIAELDIHAIHHTATRRNATPEQIAGFHVFSRDWPGIGYTFVISAQGMIFQTNRLETMAYGVGGQNHRALSTALIGDFRFGEQPTPAQIDSLRWLHHVWLPQVLGRRLQPLGHREIPGQATACPGTSWDWQAVLAQPLFSAA